MDSNLQLSDTWLDLIASLDTSSADKPLSEAWLEMISIVDTPASNQPVPCCPFLDILPHDVRVEIYRFLLVARYNKGAIDVKCKEYDEKRGSILGGPDHSYSLHTSILGTNRFIRKEAMEIFRRENVFISIMHDTFESCYSRGQTRLSLEVRGVAVLARGCQARNFPEVAMYIDFDAGNTPDNRNAYQRATTVFLVEGLPAACVSLQRSLNCYRIPKVHMQVTLSPPFLQWGVFSKYGHPKSGSKVSKCLDPLTQLRGARFVHFYGPGSSIFNAAASAAIGRRPRSARSTMALGEARFNLGDIAWAEGDSEKAISEYQAALRAPYERLKAGLSTNKTTRFWSLDVTLHVPLGGRVMTPT